MRLFRLKRNVWKYLIFQFFIINFLFSPTFSNGVYAADVARCEIDTPLIDQHATLGFNRDAELIPSLGSPKILSVAIDFADTKMETKPNLVISNIVNLETVENFYAYVSNGKFTPKFDIFPEVIRIPRESYKYGNSLNEDSYANGIRQSQRLLSDTAQQINENINLSEYSAIMVFVSQGNSFSGHVGLTYLEHKGFVISKNGEFHNLSLIGAGIAKNGPIYAARVVVHEVGHLMGLPDLYSYSENGYWQYNSPSIFSSMGSLQGSESDSLGWNKFILKWIDESEIECIVESNISKVLKLSNSREKQVGKYKLVIIKMSEFRVIVIESIPLKGFFSSSKLGGFLVYEVDSSRPTGAVPIRIISKSSELSDRKPSPSLPDWLRLAEAPLTSNTYLVYQGIRIENFVDSKEGQVLRIYSGDSAKVAATNWKKSINTQLKELICVRGKSVRIIKGESAKCPRGYSIKSYSE